MRVVINQREVNLPSQEGTSIGELIEALGVLIDPSEIVTMVEVDGEAFSAGDADHYVRRSTAGVRQLGLTTSTPAAFAVAKHRELAGNLTVVAAKAERAAELLRQGEDREANRLLAATMDELRLVLVLDHQLATLDPSIHPLPMERFHELGMALLGAQERRAWPLLCDLLEKRLVPTLRTLGAEPPSAAVISGVRPRTAR